MAKAIATTNIRSLILLLLLQVLLQAKAVSQQSANTVLFLVDTGSTGGVQSPYKNFYYHDISLQGHPIHFASDSFLVQVDHPFFLLQANEAQNPFLIYPGETIHLQVLATGEARLTVPGNTRRTDELNFFTELVRETGNLSYAFKLPPFLKKVNTVAQLQQYETMIGDTRITRMRLLTEYAGKQSYSQDFVAIATTAINSTAFRDSLELYAFNKEYLQSQQLFQQKLTAKASSLQNIPLAPLRFGLQAIADLSNVAASGNIRYINYTSNDFEQQMKTINNTFTGQYREYLLFKTIYEAASRYVDIPKAYLDSFYSSSRNTTYRSMISGKITEAAGATATKDDMLVDDAGQQASLATLLKKHSGKLVLLDFWASWCAPCREEMKYSKELMKKLAGKPVAFVYLSIDENRKAWKQAALQEKLSANSYLLLTPGRAKIMIEQQVMGVPRYMLINKAGKFVSYDAPRPSDPLLLTLIEKHL